MKYTPSPRLCVPDLWGLALTADHGGAVSGRRQTRCGRLTPQIQQVAAWPVASPLVSALPRKPLDTVASYHRDANVKQRPTEVCAEVSRGGGGAGPLILKLHANEVLLNPSFMSLAVCVPPIRLYYGFRSMIESSILGFMLVFCSLLNSDCTNEKLKELLM